MCGGPGTPKFQLSAVVMRLARLSHALARIGKRNPLHAWSFSLVVFMLLCAIKASAKAVESPAIKRTKRLLMKVIRQDQQLCFVMFNVAKQLPVVLLVWNLSSKIIRIHSMFQGLHEFTTRESGAP